MAQIPTYPALIAYEVAFNVPLNDTAIPPWYTDMSTRTVFSSDVTRGRQYELDQNPTGQGNLPLDNRDGDLDPSNVASPFAPNILPYRPGRIRAKIGANLLTIDQATAGEGSPYPAGSPAWYIGVTNPVASITLASSGSAYQGTQVYSSVLGSGATTAAVIAQIATVPAVYTQAYSFQAQARIPSGSSMSTCAVMTWYSNTGTSLGTVTGSASTLTSGSSTWVQLSVSGTAPAGATCASVSVQIASGTTGTSTTWQLDGLQWEQSATPTTWQMPQTASANMFDRAIATGLASMNPTSTTDGAYLHFYTPGTVPAQVTNLPAAPTGHTTAVSWSVLTGTTSTSTALYVGNWLNKGLIGPQEDTVQVTAGLAYTASWYTMRTASADTTIQVTPTITWYSLAGTQLSTSSGSAVTVTVSPTWSARVTVTGTAPAGAAWGRISEAVTTPASTTAANTIYHAAFQMEQASSASTWTDPGPTYYTLSGSIERWPQTWLMDGGVFGQTQAVVVDGFAALAQGQLPDPFVSEVLTYNPNFFYQLADPAGSASCADTAGRRIAAPIDHSTAGAGSLTFGTSVTSANPTGGVKGSSGTCAAFANTDTTATGPQSYVALHDTTVSPGPPQTGSWSRILTFQTPTQPLGLGNAYNLWTAYPPTFYGGNFSSFFIAITNSGTLNLQLTNSSNVGFNYHGSSSICDGNWHMIAISADPAGGSMSFWVDGVQVVFSGSPGALAGITSDAVGCSVQFGANTFSWGFVGDIAHVIELPVAMTSTVMANLYNSWRSASAGESSGFRAQRILKWVGYNGHYNLDLGSTTDMGPATDATGSSALDALNATAVTESGNVYVASNGALQFKARSDRYNRLTPMYVFGENAQFGEWPYESVTIDFDPSHLYNSIQVTQYSTSQVASAVSTASATQYSRRILPLTMNQALFTETQDAANYLLTRYQSANLRVSDIVLHPAAVPGLFNVCLALEIGTRVRVMRRPPTAPAVQVDAFIESMNWQVDPATGDVKLHLQCSPADLQVYWTLGALHTTLASSASASATSITINALPDSAYNTLAQSLPQGYQLVLDPGTAVAETVTISPPLPATNIGYSSATVNLTSGLLYAHASGATVCEPLAYGYTDPTAWDAASQIGAASTSFAAAASAGATTITVNALGDTSRNALGSDWATGDLLWLSPGTSAFEGYNLLTPNQATAGEGALPLATGTNATAVGMGCSYATLAVTASASAWQGSNVWQATIPASSATGSALLYVSKVAVTAGLAFTASWYVRSATTGANPQVTAVITWLSATGGSLSTSTGSPASLTGSPAGAWTRVTASGTAPAGAVWALVAVNLTGSSPGSSWAWQADGGQVEQAASASTWNQTPQVLSVAAAQPGYSTCVLTLASALANNHSAGDTVCDPLPPGTSAPPTGTARLTY